GQNPRIRSPALPLNTGPDAMFPVTPITGGRPAALLSPPRGVLKTKTPALRGRGPGPGRRVTFCGEGKRARQVEPTNLPTVFARWLQGAANRRAARALSAEKRFRVAPAI